MRFNVKRIENTLLKTIEKEYIGTTGMYVTIENINYDCASGTCEILGRFGRCMDEDDKDWVKNFELLLRGSDLSNYSYLRGAFAQYIYDMDMEN